MIGSMWSLLLLNVFLFMMAAQFLHSEQSAIVIVIHLLHAAKDGPEILRLVTHDMGDQVHVLHAGRNGTFSFLLPENLKDQMLAFIKPFELSKDGVTIKSVEDIPIEHGWKHKRRNRRSIEEFQLETYNTYASIAEYINKLADAYPEVCQTEVIGETFEGNEIIVIKIHGYNSTKARVRILLDGTQHAREWISPAVLVFIINQLVTQYSANHSQTLDVLEKYEFHIVPVVNVDGYEYSHNNSRGRFWRKNRRPNDDGSCIGVDLNRNWGFHWSGAGSSPYECSDIYHGKSEFSELETTALADYINRYNGTWHSYFSFHSYGQLILFPWSHSSMQSPDHFHHLMAGEKMAEGIKKQYNSTVYRVGSVGTMLYRASGSAESWAYGSGKFPYSYTVELPDVYHFVIPKSRIAPTSMEILSGLRSYISYIEETRPELYYQLLERNEMLNDDESTSTPTIDAVTNKLTTTQYNFTRSVPTTSVPPTSTSYFSLTTRSRPSPSLSNNLTHQQSATTFSLKPTATDTTSTIFRSTERLKPRTTASNNIFSSKQVTMTSIFSTTDSEENFSATASKTSLPSSSQNTHQELTQNVSSNFVQSTTPNASQENLNIVSNITSTAQVTSSSQMISSTAKLAEATKTEAIPVCGPKCRKSFHLQDEPEIYTSGANSNQILFLSVYLLYIIAMHLFT